MKLKFILHGIVPRFYHDNTRDRNCAWIQTQRVNRIGYPEDLLAIVNQPQGYPNTDEDNEGWKNYYLKKL